MNMKKIFTIVAIILACLSLFIFLFPSFYEQKKTNDRCQKARDAKAAKAAAAKEDAESESELSQQVIIESN